MHVIDVDVPAISMNAPNSMKTLSNGFLPTVIWFIIMDD
jgi:hypothetical protein